MSWFLTILLTCLPLVSFLSVSDACEKQLLADAIGKLGKKTDLEANAEIFRLLETCPQQSMHLLIQSLHPIPDSTIQPPDVGIDSESMRVVWRLRAMRYLTSGKEFYATTKTDPKQMEENRANFLSSSSKHGIPFFRVWMSRDTVYVAPADAQQAIILKWKEWYSENGKSFKYRSSQDINEWYF